MEQKKVLEAATANGLKIFLTNGMPLGPHYLAAGRGRMNFRGALHAKSLVAKIPGAKAKLPGKTVAILGSSNWTTASRGNHEVGILLEAKQTSQAAQDLECWAKNVVQHGKAMGAENQPIGNQGMGS